MWAPLVIVGLHWNQISCRKITGELCLRAYWLIDFNCRPTMHQILGIYLRIQWNIWPALCACSKLHLSVISTLYLFYCFSWLTIVTWINSGLCIDIFKICIVCLALYALASVTHEYSTTFAWFSSCLYTAYSSGSKCLSNIRVMIIWYLCLTHKTSKQICKQVD